MLLQIELKSNEDTVLLRVKRWIRYWIGHRTLGGPVKIEYIPYKEK